ncbi:ABC transporter permease [Listeria innocua]|uniref:ABC transporter permease n=1 Tax=Listeria innocua TaxID=1642 RepID=UPI001626BF30|nr:ABC transporter permease [Listeria innocua]MBC2137528.1 ABC transporter permease [Listeria innocua]
MMSVKRILGMAKKEALQIRRDKIVLRIPLVMPILWMFILSFAFVVTPNNLNLTIIDKADNVGSAKMIQKIKANENIHLESSANNRLIIKEDNSFALDLDGIDLINSRALESEIKKSIVFSNSFDIKYSYNVIDKTDLFIIPGIIGLVLQNIITFLTAISIVKEKEKGTYSQLLFSPMTFFEIIIGKIIPYFLIGIFDLFVLSFLATFFFDVNILAVLLPYLVAGILFILSSLMLGILISSISKNQMQALLFTVFLLLPSILCSNFVFPVDSMPVFLRYLSLGMPLTYFNDLSREIIIRNQPLLDLTAPLLSLIGIIVITMFLSIFILNKNRRI